VNTANRSFVLVVTTAAAPYGLLFLAGCGFGAYVAGRVADRGFSALGYGLVPPMMAVVTLLLAGAAAGAVSVARQLSATRRLCDHVDRNRMTPPTGTPAGVEVVDHDAPFAFTYGLGEPRIALSRGLVEQLSTEELVAVVAHERYHVRARDPLKLVVARSAARMCFFLPAVGHLVTRYLAGRELAADRRSVRDFGRSALAGALLKVVSGPGWGELGAAAAMADPEVLEARVDQLERGSEPPLPRLPWTSVVLSALVLGAVAGTVIVAALQGGLSMMAPAPTDALSGTEVAGAVAGGLACMGVWVWMVTVAFGRMVRNPEPLDNYMNVVSTTQP
jgi:Zn-dependent protease with chaperone function